MLYLQLNVAFTTSTMAKIRHIKTGREKNIPDHVMKNPEKRKWILGDGKDWDIVEDEKPVKAEKADSPETLPKPKAEPKPAPVKEKEPEKTVPENTGNDLESMNLTQLRQMYPDIKAVSKKEFIAQINK